VWRPYFVWGAVLIDHDKTSPVIIPADPADLVHYAALLVISNNLVAARAMLRRINTEGLEEERTEAHRRVRERVEGGNWVAPETRPQQGRNPGPAVRLAVFRRDGYICRYVHCARRTIDDGVLRLLSTVLPEDLPYHPNWKIGSVHPIYWTHTASLEHVVAWSTDGSNDVEENLVTACSCCQYAKNYYDLEILGWEITPPDDCSSRWSGLKDMEAELREAVRRNAVRS
jgi:hypothetical protein